MPKLLCRLSLVFLAMVLVSSAAEAGCDDPLVKYLAIRFDLPSKAGTFDERARLLQENHRNYCFGGKAEFERMERLARQKSEK